MIHLKGLLVKAPERALFRLEIEEASNGFWAMLELRFGVYEGFHVANDIYEV